MSFATVLGRSTAHGIVVGVDLPSGVPVDGAPPEPPPELVDEELAFASSLAPARRAGWIGGRIALRRALASLGVVPAPIFATPRGAPLLPRGFLGSVSHKRNIAVALCARSEGTATIGVDVELDAGLRFDISRKVLTEEELRLLADLPPEERAGRVLLLFSLKEALYKALDPHVQRYVGFQEVEASVAPDGTARFTLGPGLRPDPATAPRVEGKHSEVGFTSEGTWQRTDGLFLTTARVRRV